MKNFDNDFHIYAIKIKSVWYFYTKFEILKTEIISQSRKYFYSNFMDKIDAKDLCKIWQSKLHFFFSLKMLHVHHFVWT